MPIKNALVVEESDVEEYIRNGNVMGYLDTARPPRLTWRRDVVGDRHIWNDWHLIGSIVVSDDFYAALKKHKITGFQAQESRFLDEK